MMKQRIRRLFKWLLQAIKHILFELYRVSFDTVLLGGLLYGLVYMPPPERYLLDVLRLKAIQVSAGFLSGHIIGKLGFPKVYWENEGQNGLKALRIVLYFICIYAWAEGG